MATVRLPRQRLREGALPRVCVKTGRPADGTVAASFSSLPSWTYLLLLAGILPFLIAWAFGRQRVDARLPVCRGVLDRYHRRTRRASVLFGTTGVLGIAAIVSGRGLL